MALNAKIEIEVSSRVDSLGTREDFGLLLLIHRANYIKSLMGSQSRWLIPILKTHSFQSVSIFFLLNW